MKFGVIKFPGSNCDQDAYHTLKDVMGQPTEYLWHQDSDLKGVDCVVVPGGFSYGDYLRCGAIARFAPAMAATQEFAAGGGLVLGICNGFQVLCESHLLPGALLRNDNQKFVCKQVHLRAENADTPFTNALTAGQILQVPIAHGEGKYVCDDATLEELKAKKPGDLPLRASGRDDGRGADGHREPERVSGRHRRHRQRGLQRPGPDAPPGAGRRLGPWLGDGRAVFESLLRFWR